MISILVIIIVIIIIALIIGIYQKNTNAKCESKKRLDGKTVIVTGGTAGMGIEIAKDMAQRGARVIIACPFENEGTEAKRQIIQSTQNENIVFKLLDLASLESTRRFAEDITKTENRIDILVNNAGVGIPIAPITRDGMNFIMQVNYYGTFLLTLLLLPLLKKTGKPLEPSRVVNTSSVLHYRGKIDFDNVCDTSLWSRIQMYSNSKIYLVLFSRELTKRLKDSYVVINNVDPGAVGTRIFESIDKISGIIVAFLCNMLFKTPLEGAQTAIHVALDDDAGKVSGEFFKNCKLSRATKKAYNDKHAKIVWEESVRLVKLSDSESEIFFN